MSWRHRCHRTPMYPQGMWRPRKFCLLWYDINSILTLIVIRLLKEERIITISGASIRVPWTAQPGCHQICTEIWISVFKFRKWHYKHVFFYYFFSLLSCTLSQLELQLVLRYLLFFFATNCFIFNFFFILSCIYFVNDRASMGSLPLCTMLYM